MVADGCLYGRFQPFHNRHLENVQTALERCCFLWIGLAEPFPADPRGDRRALLDNPLSYHERQFMITRTLVAEGIALDQFSFAPFPVSSPAILSHFLDPQVTCFVTGRTEREREEQAVLESAGYPCELLPEGAPPIEEAALRSLLLTGDDSWRDFVPTSVSYYLDELDLPARLRALHHHKP